MTDLPESHGIWIVNAAPLIGLAKVGCLGLLQNEAGNRLVLLQALQSVGLFLPSDDVLRETLLPFGEIWPSDKTT